MSRLAAVAGMTIAMLTSLGAMAGAATIFQQSFPTSTLTDYIGATTPSSGQWNAISTSGAGTATDAGSFTGTASYSILISAAAAGNTVNVANAAACITPANSCQTIPVDIARTDATGLRLFSVTFQLSPELQLCGPAGSNILEGDYLGNVSATSFFVTSNGGGSYTADGTILGSPCGATASSGNLFNIRVTNTGGSGTGTVTVISVVLRDCSNATLASTIGTTGSATIDNTPVTVAAISSPQNVAEQATLTVTPTATVTGCASGSVTWSISPALPAGATFSPSSGVISWTPDCAAGEGGAGGTYGPFTLTATAASGDAGSSNAFSIHVIDTPGTVVVVVTPDPQTVEEQSLLTVAPALTVGGCASSPAPVWSISPALPAGASFSASSGGITWTPACGDAGPYGPFTLTATVTNGAEVYSGSAAFSIVVSHKAGTVTIAGVSDPENVTENSLLTITPSASATPCAVGPYTWSISPALPAGATFSTSTGQITWTPACGEAGTYGPFALSATAATGEFGSTSFSIVVAHLVGTVAVSGVSDPENVTENSLLTITPSATTTPCAGAPLTWSISPALPAGATFSTSTGQITWTPACGEAGTYGPFALSATAATGETGATSFSIVVAHLVGTVAVSVSDPQTVAEGSLLTVTPGLVTSPCVNAGSIVWSLTPALPGGASFSSSSGVITWTPSCSQSGTYGPFTLTATAGTGESGNAVFSIVVTDVPSSIGAPASISTVQVLLGNPAGERTGIVVSFSPVAGAVSYKVYRARFGHYPEYDDAGGAAPAAPTSWPPSADWTLTGVTTSGDTDTPGARDYWYYVVYAQNGCGDVSVASTMTGGTLDYHLGDVSDGIEPGTGDNLVDTADISALGAHYGIPLAPADPYDYLDVGPTTTSYVDGRPVTDNLLNFEDLVMFAINYGQVTTVLRTAPAPVTDATPAAHDELSITAPGSVAPGASVKVTLDAQGTGRVQALSTKLTWDPAVVEPVSASAGEFLLAQDGMLMPMQGGTVDAAILGTRHGLSGEGTLATIEFRAIAPGDPKFGIVSVDARDARNRPISLNLTLPVPMSTPTVTLLQPAMPNPFRETSTLAFSLAKQSPVEVAIYSVDGRLVRTLFRGTKDPGSYSLVWDGRDDRGASMPGGVYFAHMVTTQGKFSRTLTRVR